MGDEQRVRTMAGWIGVQISKSRVRTPDKSGYGLYRVRGTAKSLGRGRHDYVGPWTAYAFTLEEIEKQIAVAIGAGRPEGPSALILRPADKEMCELVTVPTRWTSAYRGPRTLGVPAFAGVRSAVRTEVCRALSVRVSEAMTTTERDDQGSAQMLNRRYLKAKYGIETDTPRSRQRAQNAEFQAEHEERRRYGKQARHRDRPRMLQGRTVVGQPNGRQPGWAGLPSDPPPLR